MCGRLDQNDIDRLMNGFEWADEIINRSEAPPRWNVPPGTYRPVLHVSEGRLVAEDLYWSYRSAWAAAQEPAPGRKPIRIAVNARVEKIMGAYWKPLLRKGRGIVCANGWYEWTGPKGAKQPWHIHRKDRAALYILSLANYGPFTVNREESGFVLITADSLGGMVDVHDRRPVCVDGETARRWLNPDITAEEAAEIARTAMLDSSLFEWYEVSRELNTGADNAEVAKALTPAVSDETLARDAVGAPA